MPEFEPGGTWLMVNVTETLSISALLGIADRSKATTALRK
jgi:hypothetical protein